MSSAGGVQVDSGAGGERLFIAIDSSSVMSDIGSESESRTMMQEQLSQPRQPKGSCCLVLKGITFVVSADSWLAPGPVTTASTACLTHKSTLSLSYR